MYILCNKNNIWNIYIYENIYALGEKKNIITKHNIKTYLRPQGSFSAMLSTFLAILGKRSAGNKTSPHANCTCFALLNSTSNRFARAWQAPSNSSAVPTIIINI